MCLESIADCVPANDGRSSHPSHRRLARRSVALSAPVLASTEHVVTPEPPWSPPPAALVLAKLRHAITVFLSTLDSERVRRLSGLHGETCYVLLRDHFSNTLHGAALLSKAPPPVEWLTIKGAGPTVDSKYVRMDSEGEPGRCQEVLDPVHSGGVRS